MDIDEAIHEILFDLDLLADDPELAIRDRIYRRSEVPDKARLPYITIDPEVFDGIAQAGDAQVTARARLVQLSLWQYAPVARDDLRAAVVAALDGVRLAAGKVWRCRVRSWTTPPDPDPGIVQHAIDLIITYS